MSPIATWCPERLARAHLTAIGQPGDAKLARLVADHGAEWLWGELLDRDSAVGRRARAVDLEARVARLRDLPWQFLIPGDEAWPSALDDLDWVTRDEGRLGGIPFGLWLRGAGSLGDPDASVAIVGTRASTPYGDEVAREFAVDLGEKGVTVVSGGAYGIDAAAHRGALAGTGRTTAFLACGIDQWYPRGNGQLLDRVADSGLVVSEVAPGVAAHKASFLARNRLIAAMARVTVLVEAAHRSGALNTTAWARDMGRDVLAVPGSIFSSASLGCHKQIVENKARIVRNADDVVEALGPLQADPPLQLVADRPTDELPPHLLAVREELPAHDAVEVDHLVRATGFTTPACLAALADLELRGLAIQRLDGRWMLARPH